MNRWVHPEPAPLPSGEQKLIPEQSASWLSVLTIFWLSPLLRVGFSRPLEKEDLWKLPSNRLADEVSQSFEHQLYSRYPPEERPPHLREALPSRKKFDRSLIWSIHATYWRRWWLAGFMRLVASVGPTLTALVTRELLAWLSASHAWHRADDETRQQLVRPHGVAYGIGMTLVLFVMQEITSLMQTHYVILTCVTAMMIRTAIIDTLLKKSLRMSNKAALEHSAGQFTTMVSVDCTALEMSCMYFHNSWVTPVVVIVGVGLLINNLGTSALVGFAVLAIGVPLQAGIMKIMYQQRLKNVAATDKRVSLTNEILQGIRLIKYYAWEAFYSHRVSEFRSQELAALRRSVIAQSASAAILAFIPVLAAVLTFITYAYTGHKLEVSTVFSSLLIFNTLRSPLAILMYVIRAMLGGHVAIKRINAYLNSEDADEGYELNKEAPDAVTVDASFAWETRSKTTSASDSSKPSAQDPAKTTTTGPSKSRKEPSPSSPILPVLSADTSSLGNGVEDEAMNDLPFLLQDVKINIARGAFVAIIGKIGSGKSSLMQGMIGEMRRTRGSVTFGGPVAYVPQSPWIMNATLRQNIVFGLEDDEARFQSVVKACCLTRDLELLADGEHTEIGEKGVNLSGGQRARVSLARAAYANSDVVLMDDCLSAVDAHTSQALINDCFLSGPMAGKTRILITHALHVLDKANYIYVIDKGRIAEEGTYLDLRRSGHIFSHLMDEYGNQEVDEEVSNVVSPQPTISANKKAVDEAVEPVKSKIITQLMQAEERETGGITWTTYHEYLRYGGGLSWAILIVTLLVLSQAAQVGNNLFLGFWTSQSIHGFAQNDYMVVYAGLGIAQAVMTFAVSVAFSLLGVVAGSRIFMAALKGVLKSPASFFDTTPMGRIMSRLSQDQYTVDQELPINQFEVMMMVMTLFGTIALVFYTIPLLGIIFAPLGVYYYIQSTYYRRSIMEARRLDSLLRSGLYATLTETLTGMSSVRAYRQEERFSQITRLRLDAQNQAKYLVIFIQRWLSMRLDLLGNTLLFGIGLYASGQRFALDPAKIGVVLSYSISITQIMNEMVYLYSTVEQNMNSTERMLYYTQLPAEGQKVTPRKPPASSPSSGAIQFAGVQFAYRHGLPLVLDGNSFSVKAQEKVGIVGRTGAGKSSLLQALFRMSELQGGVIEIDGVDLQYIELEELRQSLALVPQESVLFLGTLRENLDPQGLRTDAELISALQRAHLLPPPGSTEAVDTKFNLEAHIGEEGNNYSAGEKQSIAVARALVKNSKVVVLDEATSSVDAATDAKLQRTIQTEFASSTVLCIAHRLNTIAWYDRVLVMDAGKVAEYDSPLNLFDAKGIFRSLCDEALLSREDIVRIRAMVKSA